MLNTPRALNGIVTSPHHLASQAGLQILRDGGTAIEAAVACMACLGVLYPHMTGIGGDGFWLISQGDAEPIAIDACGMTGVHVDANLYQRNGLVSIPQRGPLAANTVAGTIAGWEAALKISHGWQPGLPLSRILRDAIGYADGGFPVTRSQAELTAEKLPDLLPITGFAETFLIEGKAPSEGTVMRLGRLARTLRQLADEGLDSFYRGPLSRLVAADLDEAGAPLTRDDLNDYRPLRCAPLQVRVTGAQLFNMPPPTQGVSSLMILALFDRLGVTAPEGFDHIHGIVEATKQAFLVRDREVCDPRFMRLPAMEFLRAELLDDLAGRIDPDAALPWPAPPSAGDTVWIGAVDREGRSVSLIQSIFFEFGSGVVLRNAGINWQNRGCSFSLDPNARNTIRARAKPFHTLNPALARFEDGRSMVYGTMGGEGQPQTQAALFSRYAWFNTPLQESITAPRWLLGRTWGDATATLKLENRVAPDVLAALAAAGHDVEIVPAFSSMMGHAGAIVRHPNGVLEGASDPRSDGAVAAW